MALILLQVHGLLHLLGFDHELSDEAEEEMETEEELLLKDLGWKGKGLIHSAHDAVANGSQHNDYSDGNMPNEFKDFEPLAVIILNIHGINL